MYLAMMYIETAIPKNIPATLCRHHPPYTASRPAQSVFIIKTSFVVQTIALHILYPNIHHMYLSMMYIETAIPKNIPAALCRPPVPDGVKASALSCVAWT